MREAMIGRNRRGGFKRRAPAAGSELEPAFIHALGPWAWHWGGVNGARLTVEDNQIRQVDDISGNGNHYVYVDNGDLGQLDYESDVFLTDGVSTVVWEFPYPALLKHRLNSDRITFAPRADRYPRGYGYTNNFVASGQFCLIGIGLFTRTGGAREYWGFDQTFNINIVQAPNANKVRAVNGSIGVWNDLSTATGTSGLVVLEIFRDASNDWRVIWNGTDITLGTPYNNGATITYTGFGYDQDPSSRFDDFWLEDMSFLDWVPTSQQRTDIRNSLFTKWTNLA